MTEYAAEFARWVNDAGGDSSLLEALEMEAKIYEPIGVSRSQNYDALVCPTNGTRGLLADDDYVGHGLSVDGRELPYYFEGLLTTVFNVLSRCPVLNVPSGFADNGVPTGVQIAGRTYDDGTVFRVGAALERVRPVAGQPRATTIAHHVKRAQPSVRAAAETGGSERAGVKRLINEQIGVLIVFAAHAADRPALKLLKRSDCLGVERLHVDVLDLVAAV